MSDHKAGLERLGVLIGRTRSREVGEKVFLILGSEPPRVPQSMIETQPLEIVPLSTMLGA
jgi:hypothetical protein